MTTAPVTASQAAETALPDAWRVEVRKRPDHTCPDGERALRRARELGFGAVEAIRYGRGWLLPPHLAPETVSELARELFCDPVLEEADIVAPGEPPAASDGHRIVVARRIGVMDPAAESARAALERSGLVPVASGALHVQSYHAWQVAGSLEPAELTSLGRQLLANEVIDELRVDDESLPYATAATAASSEPGAVALRDADDDELVAISAQGVLSLTLIEMQAVQAHFHELGRDPTPCELETIAQTWSEHCKHKTFTGRIRMGGRVIDNLLKSTIARATRELDRDWCISVFVDNAGIVAFEDGWDLCFKVETHNHPSAIDPYGGAGTGIGGVIRDVLGCGLGALPIANTDCFFVGPQDLPAERLPAGCLHPRRILDGVVQGVADYGNRMGIPTVNGGVWFDERYVGNPLVYAGTVGLMPRFAATKEVRPGDVIVVAGGRTGRDGIHGATFSSVELTDESAEVSSAAVQIGDPIQEKKVLDALLVARDRRLYRAVTDCGAGGLSSAVGEMGEETGAEVELERVPLKYAGLKPSEIWISEAQERMVFAVPPEHAAELIAVFEAEECEATAIGRFTDTGRLVLRFSGQVVGDLDLRFLFDGTPRPEREATWTAPALADPGCPAPEDWAEAVLRVLAHPDVASKEWIVRRYDHEVQGRSVVKPFTGPERDGPSDAAVLAPLASSTAGVAIGCGANPRQGLLDPGAMARAAIDEALRNVVAVGGDPARTAILDNFSWPNCARPEALGALVLAAEACHDAAMAYETPFISGKDSLNNEFADGERTIAIPPTLLISALAHVPDVRRAVTMDAKAAGDRLYLVGPPTRTELGGSVYLATRELDGGRVPDPDLERAPRTFRRLHAALRDGHVRAAHDLSEGGLAAAACEVAFAGRLGLAIDLARVPLAEPGPASPTVPDAVRLFSESSSRFLVEVAPEHVAAFEAALGDDAVDVGVIHDEPSVRFLASAGSVLVDLPLDRALTAWRGERCA